MGYSTNLADTNANNVNLQSKKTCARKILTNGKGLNPGHFLRTIGTQIITDV